MADDSSLAVGSRSPHLVIEELSVVRRSLVVPFEAQRSAFGSERSAAVVLITQLTSGTSILATKSSALQSEISALESSIETLETRDIVSDISKLIAGSLRAM
jgi:hypothetical protein